ncbi:hypothetical protein PCANC_17104 [Puccinia coronata f. sp. avenae]|uniref:PB1 domain-containing protein n=1 Tax=Puccinia coronata f. sp. avenae TaxID=200324 RepID=A0A2N5U5C3_9BASI|nr:hypothetical protein PCANC_17104 [Puccinia coronata f. sp. avenae]
MSSHQVIPLLIKIKYAAVTRIFQVNQPVPIWSNLSADIVERFGIPKEQPIGLQYLDPEGDTITISSQAECDTLWYQILPVAAIPSQTGGKTLRFELALIDRQSSQAQPPRTIKSNVNEHIERFWKDLPAAELVGEGEGQYLDLKKSYVLGDPKLGHRLLVRPVYKELGERFDRNSIISQRVVTGTPGVGKTFFSAYYLWVAACRKKTVVWEPFQKRQAAQSTYLMTSDGVERVAFGSPQLEEALQNSETVYIVDGQPPVLCPAWTLLVTSPHYENYKDLLKQPQSEILYMPPWSYQELQHCKAVLYADEENLPTTLMDELFDWFGGVPRYVLAFASTHFKSSGGDKHAVVKGLVDIVKEAIGKGSLTDIIKAHVARRREGEYSHRVLHLCRHPSGSLHQIHLAWASPLVEREVVERFSQEILNDMKHFLRYSDDDSQSNLRGLIFEFYAHIMLRDGGSFQARRLCEGDRTSGENDEVAFPPAKVQMFRTYEEVNLGNDVLWRSLSKNLPSIDSLRGPANFFQVTVSQTHPIKHQGLSKALEKVADKFKSPPRLYFVVPSDVYWTYKCQPYHTKDGKLFKGQLGDVVKVEQWALMIPTGAEKSAADKDAEHRAATKRKATEEVH